MSSRIQWLDGHFEIIPATGGAELTFEIPMPTANWLWSIYCQKLREKYKEIRFVDGLPGKCLYLFFNFDFFYARIPFYYFRVFAIWAIPASILGNENLQALFQAKPHSSSQKHRVAQ